MSRFRADIQRAIANAAPLKWNGDKWVPEPDLAPTFHSIEPSGEIGGALPEDLSIWGLKYNSMVSFPSREEGIELGLWKNSILVDSPNDIFEVMAEYGRIQGWAWRAFEFNLSRLRLQMPHEVQHAEAATIIGGHVPTYLFSVYAAESSPAEAHSLTYIPASLRTTLLGSAAIATYPEVLCASGVQQARAMGFANVSEVAWLAMRHGLPFPQSIKSACQIN